MPLLAPSFSITIRPSLQRSSSISVDTLHIICERDVGLFSLIQQVIANIPWAVRERRLPIVYFCDRTTYWTPNGFRGADTVWEYYFEPVVETHVASSIPRNVRETVADHHPSPYEIGFSIGNHGFASSHFGDHPALARKTLPIPYLWDDPDNELRRVASAIIRQFIRPRSYLRDEANRFFQENFRNEYVIGVHLRGTDADSSHELRPHRQDSLRLAEYAREITRLLEAQPTAKVFVATDAQSSLDYLIDRFGQHRVLAYSTIRHIGGEPAGTGPTGWIMPAYVVADRDRAAQNGMEAVVDYLLLTRCHHLVHNGSSLARTALLSAPRLGHTNTHRMPTAFDPSPHTRRSFLMK